MRFKIREYSRTGAVITYEFATYEDAQKWVQERLNNFKKINQVMDETKDRAFIRYKKELEDMLDTIKNNEMNDYEKCNKCSTEEHEGIFCRCESRNIRIAKERREKGESPWRETR